MSNSAARSRGPVPGQLAMFGESFPSPLPKRRLKTVNTPLGRLREQHAGVDVRCELCRHYQPETDSAGMCHRDETAAVAFRYGICLRFDLDR